MRQTHTGLLNALWIGIWLLTGLAGRAQVSLPDSNAIIQLYDRCLDFPAGKADSMIYYGDAIINRSKALQFRQGNIYGIRLIGIAQEYKGNYKQALQQYLNILELAKASKDASYIITALSDMAILYTEGLNQPEKSKEVYKQILRVQRENNIPASVSLSTYVNLGAIYSKLGKADSALYILNLGLREALPLQDPSSISSLYNNIGNVYYRKGDYRRALEYFQRNYQQHLSKGTEEEIWLDYLNMGDSWLALGKLDSAKIYLHKALDQAQSSRDSLQLKESYSLLAQYYHRKKDHARAYEYLQKTYYTDTSLLNFETRNAIATLQEQFNAAEREKENQKLIAGIEKAQIQNRFSIGVAIGASLLGFMILYAWQQKRKANAELTQLNQTITVQNQKLATLNQEKNKLMSMVSHDLSTPFASVRMWAEVLGKQKETIPEQQQAIEKILASAQRGENLIQQILQVEKMGTLQQALALEEIQLSRFIAHLLTDFESKAKAKNIELLYEAPSQEVELLTDQQIIARILQNLVSNALKFTEPGKKVWVRLQDTTEHVLIEVEDQGQGIPAQEMNLLFTPYGQLSSRPTQGESSTGLGLSIVKRLVDELQGTISCQSRPQQGTRFTVRLPR